jgi:hypothetical protein
MAKVNLNLGYPLLVGCLLGLLQTGLFFQLTFALSSGFMTYLLIVICWLLGSAIGAYYVSHWQVSLRLCLLLMLIAYAVCCYLVNSNPFNTHIWFIYAGLIGLAGLYPGVFFARTAKVYAVRPLFFWENNGFIAGLVISTILYMLMGRIIFWGLPIVVALIVEMLAPPYQPSA